ncbi:hypothetical protein HI914_07056 [Erysiphe necator]|nr:hypothetical protein HI914_07056 [Erysiphe necator]
MHSRSIHNYLHTLNPGLATVIGRMVRPLLSFFSLLELPGRANISVDEERLVEDYGQADEGGWTFKAYFLGTYQHLICPFSISRRGYLRSSTGMEILM